MTMFRLFIRNIKNTLRGRSVRVSLPENRIGYSLEEGEASIRIAHLERARFYHDGINARLERLAESYLLSNLVWKPGDLMIDCGANIGELGMWATARNINYIGIEPEAAEYELLCNNVPGCHHYNGGLWSFDGELEFFSKPDTADSSFVKPKDYNGKTMMPVLSGESLLQRFGVEKIKLLKVEAEGAEPEVLEGFSGVLEKIDYIVVEAGYERGVNQEDTFMSCHEFLSRKSFVLIGSNLKDNKFLYNLVSTTKRNG